MDRVVVSSQDILSQDCDDVIIIKKVSRCGAYHTDLQCFAVELPDLPVAQNIAKDFDKSVDPEDGCHDEEEYDPTVLLNPEHKQKAPFRYGSLELLPSH